MRSCDLDVYPFDLETGRVWSVVVVALVASDLWSLAVRTTGREDGLRAVHGKVA